MKKSKILLVALMSLSLVGCGEDKSSSSPISEDKIVNNTPSATNTDSTVTTDESTSLSTSEIESPASSEATTTSTYNPYSEGWGNDITDKMIKYLGGHVIPKFSMGKPDCYWETNSTSDYGHLTLEGTSSFSSSTANDIVTIFNSRTSDGWEVVSSSSTEVKVKNETYKVEGRIYEEDDYIWATFTYDEPYDSTAFTGWDSEAVTLMNDNLNKVLPAFYLGTANPTCDWTTTSSYSNDYCLKIIGGKWNDQVIADAETLIANSTEWVKDTSSTSSSFVATFTDATIGTITVTIEAYSKSTSIKVIRLIATIKEAWNPNNFTSWPTDIQNDFANYFDGHSLPLIYLGTNSPTSYYYSYSEYLSITGGDWDDTNTVSTVKQAFLDDNTKSGTVTSPETLWEISEDNTSSYPLTAKKTYSDGCSIKVKLYNYSYYGKAYLYVYYYPSFTQTATSWTTEISDIFTSSFDGHSIPYVWIGTDSPTVYDYTDSYGYLQIYGSKWNDLALTYFDSAFSSDTSWTKVTDYTDHDDYYYASSYVAYTKTFSDGHKIDVVLPDCTTSTSTYAKCCLYIYIDEVFDSSLAGSDWDSTILAEFSSKCSYNDSEGNTKYDRIPFFYTGTAKPILGTGSEKTIIIECAHTWNDQILTNAKTAFSNDTNYTWTIKDTSSLTSYSYTYYGEFLSSVSESNYYFDVLIYKSTYGKVTLKISYVKSYDKESWTSSLGDWNSTTKAGFTSQLDSHSLPVVYLGSDSETTTTGTNSITISGGYMDDRIIKDTLTAFKKDEWHVFETTENGYGSVYGFKRFTDGDVIRFKLYAYDTSTPTTTLEASLSSKGTNSGDTTWSDSFKTSLQSSLGITPSDLTFFDLGTTATLTKYNYGDNVYKINGGTSCTPNLSFTVLDTLLSETDDEGNSTWKLVSLSYFTYSMGCDFVARKECSSGTISIRYVSNYSGGPSVYITFAPKYKNSASLEEGTTWSDSISSSITSSLGTTIPYVDLGTSVSISATTGKVVLSGNAYSSEMFTDVKSVFESDGYTCIIFKRSETDIELYGTKEVTISGENKTISFSLSSVSDSYYTTITTTLTVYAY